MKKFLKRLLFGIATSLLIVVGIYSLFGIISTLLDLAVTMLSNLEGVLDWVISILIYSIILGFGLFLVAIIVYGCWFFYDHYYKKLYGNNNR